MLKKKIQNWYGKYERPISSLSLIGGFVFDAVTLKRVDLFWENLWVIGHIVIVGVCIVLINAIDRQEGDEANPSKLHFWLTNLQQFFYGGIWSTFLVFYFRSSDITAGWPFLLILALSFWANESLKRHFVRLTFQVSLFFLAVFCFAIFLVPVMLHSIGAWMFVLSGLVSLVFIILFLWIIWLSSGRKFKESRFQLFGFILIIYLLVNILYFTDLIPPIPLSLKDGGVYYALVENPRGGYVATSEQKSWLNYFKLYPDFHYLEGQPIFVYSAVFSPPGLDVLVVHEWQKKDSSGNWVTTDKILLNIVGGRDGGYRTYSEKKFGLVEGQWRVNVKTTRGQVVSRVRFNLVSITTLPKIIQEIK